VGAAGAARFGELVGGGYYDGAKFFRVLPGFVVQFGLPADPKTAPKAGNLADDPVTQTNAKGPSRSPRRAEYAHHASIHQPDGQQAAGRYGLRAVRKVVSAWTWWTSCTPDTAKARRTAAGPTRPRSAAGQRLSGREFPEDGRDHQGQRQRVARLRDGAARVLRHEGCEALRFDAQADVERSKQRVDALAASKRIS